MTLVTLGVAAGAGAIMQAQATQTEESRLVIETFRIPYGRPISEAIKDASDLVRLARTTGEYKSVRLYVHEWGGDFALYILLEPKSWASLKTGFEKMRDAKPDLMSGPFQFSAHSDEILSEIAVN